MHTSSSFQDIDRSYREELLKLPNVLKSVHEQLCNPDISFSLEGNELSKAILLRMEAYYRMQKEITNFLGKRYIGAGADFFVETILFYLKVFASRSNSDFEFASERQIERRRNALRPDISIWQGEALITAIECKTQLGWVRNQWQKDFEQRQTLIKSIHPDAKVYLVILTQENWYGLNTIEPRERDRYVLSKVWPTEINEANLENIIINPVEELFKVIFNR